MALLLLSFIAGVLTVLAPCVLPLLPVIIGGSLVSGGKRKPYVITASLAVSVVVFTLVLKWSTAFITIPPYVWTYLSGGILVLFALTILFPAYWAQMLSVFGFGKSANKMLAVGYNTEGIAGDILVGLALGPVFTTCSPTYFVILASVLPATFLLGLVYLIAYAVGLSLVLLLISLLGQRFVEKLDVLSRPNGSFKIVIGIIFLIVGIAIITGLDKTFETVLVNHLPFDITTVERGLLTNIK